MDGAVLRQQRSVPLQSRGGIPSWGVAVATERIARVEMDANMDFGSNILLYLVSGGGCPESSTVSDINKVSAGEGGGLVSWGAGEWALSAVCVFSEY